MNGEYKYRNPLPVACQRSRLTFRLNGSHVVQHGTTSRAIYRKCSRIFVEVVIVGCDCYIESRKEVWFF